MKKLEDDLNRKIILQRNIHSYYEHRAKTISIIFKIIFIVVPAIIAFIAFSDLIFLKKFIKWLTKDHITLIIGLGSFFVFLSAVFDEIFDITGKYKEHRNAIEQYTQLLRDIKLINLQKLKDFEYNSKLELYNQRYLQIASNAIPFTNKEFAKAELNIIKNNIIRQVRKQEPFLYFWQIKSKAKKMLEYTKIEEEIKLPLGLDSFKSYAVTVTKID